MVNKIYLTTTKNKAIKLWKVTYKENKVKLSESFKTQEKALIFIRDNFTTFLLYIHGNDAKFSHVLKIEGTEIKYFKRKKVPNDPEENKKVEAYNLETETIIKTLFGAELDREGNLLKAEPAVLAKNVKTTTTTTTTKTTKKAADPEAVPVGQACPKPTYGWLEFFVIVSMVTAIIAMIITFAI